MSESTRSVTDSNFEAEVLASPVPVLVDYWAEWCAPCRMISPLVNESASTYSGQLNVAKLNIDENPQIASRYHVRSIPTLMLFKGGVPVATKVGALSKSQLAAFIESNL
ncbi:MAG: thioredoxin [Gammaproteobacteria bacterium]